MLEQLDQVDWKRLTHAYGSAKDVPMLLRLLTDPRETVREEALFALNGRINHQGSIYEATAYTVPFLVELASNPAVPDRHNVLSLISGAAAGWTAALRDAPADLSRTPLIFRCSADRVASEHPDREAAHRAVEREFAAIEHLLRDPDHLVRVAAAFVFAHLFERSEAAEALIRMIESEPDDRVRAAALFALEELAHGASSGRVDAAAIRCFTQLFDDEESGPDSRLSAGLALLYRGEAARQAETLALVRPRLALELHSLIQVPSLRHARDLFSLVTRSLLAWPETRVEWILEGLESLEPEVISAAVSEVGYLCREVSWGPSRLAPALRKLADSANPESRSAAVYGLAELGSTGGEFLWELSDHPSESLRTEAAARLARMRTRETERLIRFDETPPAVLEPVPTLVAVVERHEGARRWDDVERVCDALRSLGFHRSAAAEATEPVRRQIAHAYTTISGNSLAASQLRITALRTLWKVTRDPNVVVPELIRAVEPDRHGLLALEQLREIGPAASAAIPRLTEIVDSERRWPPDGDHCGCIPDDEVFRAAAQIAIDSIATVP